MANLPTIAVSTIITNPFSTKYLAYLAFLESWAPVVDEIILVDGNTTDCSFEVAKSWVSTSDWRKVRRINTVETYWSPDDRWHALQAMHNYYTGLCASDCDWVITVNADNVLCRETAHNLREALALHSDADAVYLRRGKPSDGIMRRRLDTRAAAVNRRRVRATGLPLAFGADSKKWGFDFPIIATHKTRFIDPSNQVVKQVLSGPPYLTNRVIDLECAVFGHYFFDRPVLLNKLRRWDEAFARYLGWAPKRDLEFRSRHRLFGARRFLSKDEVLQNDFPPEINRVIAEFYDPGMLGAAVHEASPGQDQAARVFSRFLGLERHLRGQSMRLHGYRGLNDMHMWVPLDAADPEPLDVADAYSRQDRFLS